jgi:16S rRNA (cytidine1402-2'-O)-methyltransferase
MSGELYLLPVPLAAGTASAVLPVSTLAAARSIDYFLAENAKSARAFVKEIGHPKPIQDLRFVEIGHRPDAASIAQWLAPVVAGATCAIVSEAGCPGVADPGAQIVAHAHRLGIAVRPLVGPSSLLLALMASGMNGQAFRFVGYLPQDAAALTARLRELERNARTGETQLWIETPYRNDRMLEAVLAGCAADTRLLVATDLTSPTEWVRAAPIATWKTDAATQRPLLHKRPTVFGLVGPGH